MIFSKKKVRILIQRDLANVMQYGLSAPKYAERIWVNPSQVKFLLGGKDIVDDGKNRNRELSGFVLHGKWPHEKAILVEEEKKYRVVYRIGLMESHGKKQEYMNIYFVV